MRAFSTGAPTLTADARSRARSSTPPASTEVPAVPDDMSDDPAVAVTLSSPSCSVTPPVGSSETAIAFGVSREDVTEFWKMLQRQSVPLNYGTMLPNTLHGSIRSVATLKNFFEALVPGTYLVSAGQNDITVSS
ncbi:hypothetical protein L917_11116 [Phytophthora nicotianae]|uniref:Uncharacterized protein n=1 Tax=Phytophthora nicotianae TaxID=4792 RepID=W2KY01_PHYNI|nr:hypothetical protein L916_11218 [Phytophthora nicotianae]ETL90061.1 hypothetical protein L917_11116 [Phytophthora nicotianae]